MKAPSDSADNKIFRNALSKDLPFFLILMLVVAVLYVPSLWQGRMMDDHMILKKCEELPFTALLSEGLEASRSELGDFWWIEQETLFHYFRPLLVFTFWLPVQLADFSDFFQHVINLLLHLLSAGLLFALAKRLFRDPWIAFLSALLFAVSIHHLLAVQWIAARKELLTGALLILAFSEHTKQRFHWASLAFAGALLSGEHSVFFPVLALIWDLFSRRSGSRTPRRIWIVYAAVLLGYLIIRTAVLGGIPLPVSPYYQMPFQGRDFEYLFFKLAALVFSLTSSVPFAARWIIWEWINCPLLMLAGLAAAAAILVFLFKAAEKRSLCLAFCSMAVVSFIPFLFFEGLPFYLYTPYVFFALAVGASLSLNSRYPGLSPSLPRKILPAAVLLTVLLNLGAGLFFFWSASGAFLKIPQAQLDELAAVLDGEAEDRPVFIVDLPNSFPVPYFHFSSALAEKTGHDPRRLAVLSAKRDNISGNLSEARALGTVKFEVGRATRPYFDSSLRNAAWLYDDGIAVEGRTFRRSFYSVTIAEIPEEAGRPGRAQRFFSRERGILTLRIDCSEEIPPPLVIGFDGKDPIVLLDMKKSTESDMGSLSSVNAGVDYLLSRLADEKGVPPRAVANPETIVPGPGSKAGIGPLFDRMIQKDPVFRRAYFSFLSDMDGLNAKIAEEAGGHFFMQAAMYGSEEYSRSIEAIGGTSDVQLTSNAFGVTWDSVMDRARGFAQESLSREKLDLTEEERTEVINLLSLAQLAALSNRVMPDDYLAEWEKRHPERLKAPPDPPQGVLTRIWQGVCESIPWMYHAGALPWKEFPADNPHMAYDFFHFFSHAWIVCYNLYREKYFLGCTITQELIDSEIRASKRVSFGHEIFTLIAKQGFLEITPVDYLPENLREMSHFLNLKGLPFAEAIRDISVGMDGAVYGAALAVSRQRLKPGDRTVHACFVRIPQPGQNKPGR